MYLGEAENCGVAACAPCPCIEVNMNHGNHGPTGEQNARRTTNTLVHAGVFLQRPNRDRLNMKQI